MDGVLSDRIAPPLFEVLGAVPGVVSVTVVGSVTEQNDLRAVSDIDTIVVVDQLTEAVFNACVRTVEALSGETVGLPGYQVAVNATFGPLKFDTPNTSSALDGL